MEIALTSKGRKVQLPITTEEHRREVFNMLLEDGDITDDWMCWLLFVPEAKSSYINGAILEYRKENNLPEWHR